MNRNEAKAAMMFFNSMWGHEDARIPTPLFISEAMESLGLAAGSAVGEAWVAAAKYEEAKRNPPRTATEVRASTEPRIKCKTYNPHLRVSQEWWDDQILPEGIPVKEFSRGELRAVLGRNPDIDVEAVIADLGRKKPQPIWPGQQVTNSVSKESKSCYPHLYSGRSFNSSMDTHESGRGYSNSPSWSKHIDGTEIGDIVDLIPRDSFTEPPPSGSNSVLAYVERVHAWRSVSSTDVRRYPISHSWWIPMPPKPYVPVGSFDQYKVDKT